MPSLCVYLVNSGLGHIGQYSWVTYPRESHKGHLSHCGPEATDTGSCMITGKKWRPSARQGHTIDDCGSRVVVDLGKELGCGDGAERGRGGKELPTDFLSEKSSWL